MSQGSEQPGHVRRGYAWASDGQIHYRCSGPTAARSPLLVLHDLPGSSGPFDAFLAEMGHDRSAIAADLPGSGMSDPLKRAGDWDAYAVSMMELVTDLGLGMADVLGVGKGGSIALAMARQEPDMVRKLVLISAPPPDGLLRQPILALDLAGFPETRVAEAAAAVRDFLDR